MNFFPSADADTLTQKPRRPRRPLAAPVRVPSPAGSPAL